jgi:hypothetical protein
MILAALFVLKFTSNDQYAKPKELPAARKRLRLGFRDFAMKCDLLLGWPRCAAATSRSILTLAQVPAARSLQSLSRRCLKAFTMAFVWAAR